MLAELFLLVVVYRVSLAVHPVQGAGQRSMVLLVQFPLHVVLDKFVRHPLDGVGGRLNSHFFGDGNAPAALGLLLLLRADLAATTASSLWAESPADYLVDFAL